MNTPLCFFLGCCERLLRDDVELIALLRGQGFICGAGEWQFSLSELHGFLSAQLAVGECPEYRVFRQQLLVSDLNTRLRAQGAEIFVVDNLGKVDLSTYGLRRLAA